jgi:hypothetical protein
MQHIYAAGQTNGVDGAISVTTIIFDDFEYTRPAKTPERFSVSMLAAELRQVKGAASPSHPQGRNSGLFSLTRPRRPV